MTVDCWGQENNNLFRSLEKEHYFHYFVVRICLKEEGNIYVFCRVRTITQNTFFCKIYCLHLRLGFGMHTYSDYLEKFMKMMRNLICCLKINENVLNKIKSNTKNGIFDAFFSRDVETTFVILCLNIGLLTRTKRQTTT